MRTAAVSLALIAGLSAQAAHAAGPNLETFVMATNGQSNYPTFGQPTPVYNNFGGFGTGEPGDGTITPSALAGYGISGTWRQTVSAGASVTDALSTSGFGNSGFGSWTYSGSTDATAQYGQLKSESQAVHSGGSDNMTANGSESYAIMREKFTPTSASAANGTSGTMRIAVSVSGSMSVTGTGGMGMLLRYNYGNNDFFVNNPPTLLETTAHIYGNGYSIYGPHSYLGNFTTPPGMAYTIGMILPSGQPTSITFGGATTTYATVPIIYGQSNTYIMGLFTEVDIGNGNGTMNSFFAHTATISGIQMFDAAGREITNFSIASGSGTPYDSNGVRLAAVAAEPSDFALLLTGALPLAALYRFATRRRAA